MPNISKLYRVCVYAFVNVAAVRMDIIYARRREVDVLLRRRVSASLMP